MTEKLPFESYEACICMSVPTDSLHPLPGRERDDDDDTSSGRGSGTDTRHLVLITAELLSAVRPQYYGTLSLPDLWLDGYLLLSPACIVRAYLITIPVMQLSPHTATSDAGADEPTSPVEPTSSAGPTASSTSILRVMMRSAQSFHDQPPGKQGVLKDIVTPFMPAGKVEYIKTAQEYLNRMDVIRQHCELANLVPLFHFTATFVGTLILDGMQMCSPLMSGRCHSQTPVVCRRDPNVDPGTRRWWCVPLPVGASIVWFGIRDLRGVPDPRCIPPRFLYCLIDDSCALICRMLRKRTGSRVSGEGQA